MQKRLLSNTEILIQSYYLVQLRQLDVMNEDLIELKWISKDYVCQKVIIIEWNKNQEILGVQYCNQQIRDCEL
ncbi:unnamed protein product [Paramecium sonneborni]|uniref:Uncharacterized protein n=1 Tax=Paramecium sonneborni TaxID=65129 RepID=A0A8S1QYV8_9CILI|nr:unnamed protein product [Paramecium sonneborni]